MTFGQFARQAGRAIKGIGLAVALLAAPQMVQAAPANPAATASAAAATPVSADAGQAAAPADAGAASAANDPHFKIAPGGYTPLAPTAGKGMPVAGAFGFQTQYSPNGQYALWMHNGLLMPVITAITLFVLFLLLVVVARFNKRANPVASKTSHNTLLEILWTGIPILILVIIAVPSISLISKQYKPAPEKALTVKATGNQWFWTYSYPDNGGVEVISNMLSDADAIKKGEPPQLGADNRMVVPAGEPIRIQTTGADVIHAFAVPSLWFKLDAIPGRINERVLFINEPGVYYGQCSELCGARHGYMPIVVEALPRDKFNAWVIAQGGKIDGASAAPTVSAPIAAAKPAA